VLSGASHQGAWLAVRRVAQSQCPAWGGSGRPARNRRRTVHNEAPQWRMVDGLGLLRAVHRGGGQFGEDSCSVAVGNGGLTAAASRSGTEAEWWSRGVEVEADHSSKQASSSGSEARHGKASNAAAHGVKQQPWRACSEAHMEVSGRWRGDVAARGERGDEATARVGEADRRALAYFRFFSRFSNNQILKSKMVAFLLSNVHQNLNRDILKHNEQLSFLSQLRIPSEFKVINSRTNSKLNFPEFLKDSNLFGKI
jgi:hypothetical protein